MFKRKDLVSVDMSYLVSPKHADEVLLTQDTLNALNALDRKVKENGGTLKFNSVSRPWTKQQQLRKAYEDYLKLSDEDKKKVPFVPLAAYPGHSFHEASRALDISLSSLRFPGIAQDQWLAKLWEISAPLGWTPIISTPDMSLSEAWHFDWMNEWDPVYRRMGYGVAAQCAILDIGNWDPNEDPAKVTCMFIQAQLLRLGKYEIGSIDGDLGLKSWKAIQSLNISSADPNQVAQLLLQM